MIKVYLRREYVTQIEGREKLSGRIYDLFNERTIWDRRFLPKLR
ncbi:MAG: hypothetical protein R3A12_11890 [Ignavibacteria bacterium]